jgi:hypothetical protein
MEFEDGGADSDYQNLTVNLGNLVDGERVNSEDDNKSMKFEEDKFKSNSSKKSSKRDSYRSSKRDSVKASQILNNNNTLTEFFKSLDYRPGQ